MASRAVLILIAWFALGCSPVSENFLRWQIAQKGLLPLSPTNPFIVTNQFIAREMEVSPTLKGFIAHRGMPNALQLQKLLFSPYLLSFYYVATNERYDLTEVEGDWIITGPLAIPAEELALFNTAAAVVPIPGATAVVTPMFTVTPSPFPTPLQTTAPTPTPPSSPVPSPSPPPPPAPTGATAAAVAPTVSPDAQADIVHTVSHHGETLRLIVGWYTGDAANTNRIARINGLEKPDILELGQSIRIPRYLLKQTAPLPSEEIERFLLGKKQDSDATR